MKIRSPNAEGRKKPEVRNPKQIRTGKNRTRYSLVTIPEFCNRLSAFRFLSAFGLRLSVFLLLFALQLFPVFGADTNLPSEEIPPLRPPLPEMPPTFWEQHGAVVIAMGVILALIGAGLVWFLTRPKPLVSTPPAVVARQALERLKPQPETSTVLSQISQTLRHYLAAVFDLSPGELTTSELCQLLDNREAVGADLAAAIGDFLRNLDQRKFRPTASLPPSDAVSEGLRLVEQCEARLLSLRQTTRSPSTVPPLAPSPPAVPAPEGSSK